MDQTKKDKCNGFCGEQECIEYQKEDPNICKRVKHRKFTDALEETIQEHQELFKDLKD